MSIFISAGSLHVFPHESPQHLFLIPQDPCKLALYCLGALPLDLRRHQQGSQSHWALKVFEKSSRGQVLEFV